ncbi:MAG: hypothetical protein HQM08_14135 [Candidatus Riflebacteria bacterium]|nr:hypothetical protein [Candidatus Riflebacteria bacterium]
MKNMFALFVAMLLAVNTVFAGEIQLRNAQGSGLEMVSEKTDGNGGMSLQMRCSLDKLYFFDVETPKGSFTVLHSPDFNFGGELGAPQLPVINQLIRIPTGAKCRIEVKSYDTQEYNLADFSISSRIFPRQPSAPKDGSEVPFFFENSAYVYSGFRGQQLTEIKEIGIMRHMRLAHLCISPVEYDPLKNKILVYNNIEFEVVMDSADMEATRAQDDALWSPAFSWMDSMVLTPKSMRFSKRNSLLTYVMFVDPMFKNEIAPFAAWKTQMGYKVDVEYTDRFGAGETMQKGIKDYLTKLYNSPTPDIPAPTYVLFVGDNEQIPAFKGVTNVYETVHPTDLFYATITPGDTLPDLITGRFSARNAGELIPQIEKTLEYEKYNLPDPSFLDNVVLVAGWDPTWSKSHAFVQLNYGKKYYFNQENGFKNVSAYYSNSAGQDGSPILADVSRGAGFVNYSAHGSTSSWKDPAVQMYDVMRLTNKGKYPLIIANCCLTNKFDQDTCFGEAWLRAKGGGAIGYIGAANSSHWDEDLWWMVGAYPIVKPNENSVPPLKEQTGIGAFDVMFQENGISNGALVQAGNLSVERSSSFLKQYYWEIIALMGDPSLRTWFGKPHTMQVDLAQNVSARSTSLKVEAPAGSYVGISNGNTLLGAAFVDANGSVDINLDPIPESIEATMVVTAPNAIPVIKKINLHK